MKTLRNIFGNVWALLGIAAFAASRGIFFGIVWARTKNLFAVMFIHAATDLLPNCKVFVRTWGI